jgi:Trk K+ transport system NAD-binding subunit
VVRRVGDYLMAEVDAPVALLGRSLVEADFRVQHGVNVLLVRPFAGPGQTHEPRAPEADYEFGAGDRLVVFGPAAAVRALRTA